jgi:uncharacterized repeat protein (TIGR01451 family)
MSHCLPAEPAWPEPPPARAPLPWQRLLGTVLLLTAGLLGSAPAWAQVAVNQILFPSNIGRALNATVSIDATRTGSLSADITVLLPPQLTAAAPTPASGCVLTGNPATAVVCTVPAGNAGDQVLLNFDVQGTQLGSFNLGASSSTSSASNTGTVRESGDLTVLQTKLPAGNLAIGQPVVFSFGPRIATTPAPGGDGLPSGAVLTLTNQLPGLSANFSVSAISSGIASCNSVASADSTRTLTCDISGPLTVAEVNAITINVTGTHGSSGNFVNVVSVLVQPSAYIDQNGSNNTSNLAYTVGTGTAYVEARGNFTSSPVATGSTQTLTLIHLNNGPSKLPSGGSISTTLAAGFKVNSLPTGCSGPAAGAELATATALTCNTGALNIGESQSFVVPLTMPLAAASGSFTVTTVLPAGYDDSAPGNNTLNLHWQAVVLGAGQAQVTVAKASSTDGITWVDDPATPPTITSENNQTRWRILITTPAAAPQSPIGTLTLTDVLPGVLNVSSPGAPAPGYQTPAISVVTSVPSGSADVSGCPASVAAGTDVLVCTFTAVTPGTTIQVLVTVDRPFFSSNLHLNTATVTSPDTVLSSGSTVSDSAALNVFPRIDLATTGLTVTPATPRIGQALQFTLTAQNLGPDQSEVGEFKLIDDLNTSTSSGSVAYGDILPSGTGMSCLVVPTGTPVPADEPTIPAGHVRVRCTNDGVVARYATRTVTISARVLKPATVPAGGYTAQVNTASVQAPGTQCEFKSGVSGSCNDGPALANNALSVSFNVAMPLVDLQQRATRVLPAGQTSFSFGQPLRYRFRLQNNGPSRAEAVQMTSVLTVPAGFTLGNPLVQKVNGSAAETGYVLDSSKNSSVSCSQSGANANLVCVLNASDPSSNWLDAGREVNFEAEFTQTGSSSTPVSFGNEALVCGAESTPLLEAAGSCNRAAANNNNLASVNDVIFPRTDLSVAKTTLTALPVAVNQPVVFNLVVRNNGAEATQRIRVQDVLPANFELVTSGPDAPSLALGAFVTAAPSTATGASLACTPTPASLSAAGQSQTVDCVINALPGPLGSGAFPGSGSAANTLTVRLVAMPKASFFTGPYLSNITNTASVRPGLDASGNPLSLDDVPGNNSSSSTLQVADINVPDMVVTQTQTPTTFTELNPGSYTLTVGNAGLVPSSGSYTVTNTLPAGITLVGAPRGSGWACSASGQVVSCSSSTPIPAAGISGSPITLDVTVAGNACATFPCTLTNVVSVAGGGEPATSAPTPAELATPPQCSVPQPTQNACRLATPVQQSGGVSGTVWLDVDHDRQLTGADVRQAGFIVELMLNGQLQRSTSTDARGDYMLTGLVPGSGYEVRFKDPTTGAYYGRPISADPAGGNDPTAFGPASVVTGGSIRNLSIPGGNTMRVNQSLPLDPNGVVYDSVTRQPVNGAVVELLTPGGDPVPAQCVLGGVNRITTAITGAGVVPGGYAFWLANPQPAGCAGDGAYQLRVTPPAGYLNAGRPSDGSLLFTSVLLPATGNLASVPGSCQGYVAGSACAIQTQSAPPTGNQPTPYYFRLPLTPATPVAFVEIVNNHIPLDPFGGTRFVITKQAAARTADVGDTMRYTITVRHIAGPQLPNVRVDDVLPAGFRYIPGTFRLAGALQSDPAGSPGPRLSFPLGTLPVNGQFTFTYFLRVGVGSQQGDGINSAQGVSVSGAQQVVSNIARARVLVTGGVFSNEACVLGKVFVDCNGNMVQDREELGIPGVRLFLQDGTGLTTDSEGKYSHCGLPPRTQVLKVDPLTLPRGSRLVTSSSRNAGDANSLFLDLKNGELQRADFIEGSCSNTVLEQVKARRAQGEVRTVETEAKGAPALKFEGKAPGYPQQGTDSARQPPVKPRVPAGRTGNDGDPPPAPVQPSVPEQNVPVPQLPAASQNTQRK